MISDKPNENDNGEALCPKCKVYCDFSEDGYWCEACTLLFNLCDMCDTNEYSILRCYGQFSDREFGLYCEKYNIRDDFITDSDSESEGKGSTHIFDDDKNPKYYVQKDNEYVLTDTTRYLWYCPTCKNYRLSYPD